MKNFLTLDAGLPSIKVINITYYLLLIVAISMAIVLILDGIADPFGELSIIFGTVVLIIVPMCLRLFFGMILKLTKNKSKIAK